MNIEFAKVSDVSSIGKTGGIYLFYGGDELLYIGKTADLRTRIIQHRNGKANTIDTCKFFESVGVLYVDDAVSRDILETILINTWKPKLNVDKTWTYQSGKCEFLNDDPEWVEKHNAEIHEFYDCINTLDL